MTVTILPDDLSGDAVRALVAEHLSGMHAHSPPESVYALGIDALRRPDIAFWVARVDGALAGCGALKHLDERSGEVKSMRTRAAFLRRGVGQAVLDTLVAAARARGYRELLLETGTGAAFEPAHALYRRNGFEGCGRFGDYEATAFNVFMRKAL